MRFTRPALIIFTAFTLIFKPGLCQQDSILTVKQAKEILLKKNFYLLAAYYEIPQAEAQLIQARVWNNPTLTWNQEAYNVQENKYLQAKNQFEAQINQAISIAGKHTNTVRLARINVALNRAQFQDVIRSLLYDLQATYNSLAANEEKEDLYQQVLRSYEQLIAASQKELQVGAISVTEDLRIKSEYIAVKATALDNANQKEQALSHLRTLLQFPKDSIFQVRQRIPIFVPSLVLDSLIGISLNSRPDIRVAQLSKALQEQNVKLQKSLGVPDVTIGYDYDKGGNYIKQYSGLMVQVPLPVFDRNQGRIQEARINQKQSEFQLDYLRINVSNQVIAAFNQYHRNHEGLSSYTDEYLTKLDQLNKNTNIYFKKRDISLLEFIDQQRIYITTYSQFIDLRQGYLDSVNTLNFSVGETVIDY
jgi:outer membrane protein, heavy metal efflux system